MSNPMKQHRERMLAQKMVRQQQSGDPWVKAKRPPGTVMGVDLASGPDQAAEVGSRLLQTLSDLSAEGRATAAAMAAAEAAADNPAYNIELHLYAQLQQLKDIRSHAARHALKAEWLPEYQGYIEGCIAESPAQQNDALIILMIWALDIKQFDLAVRIGRFAVLNDMVMPDGWTRTVAEVVTEQVAEAYLEDPALATAQHLVIQDVIDLGRGEDISDIIRAKIYKAQGLALKDYQPQEAIQSFKIALKLDKNSGVKKLIETTERAVSNAGTNESTLDVSGSQNNDTADSPAPAIDPAITATSTGD